MSIEDPINYDKKTEEFHFKPGKIYIRKNSNEQNEIEEEILHFEMSDQPWHMQTVGEIKSDEKAKPYHSTHTEGAKKQTDTTGIGNIIEHTPATDDDLRKFMRAFDSRKVSLQDWINETCEYSDLDDGEKERIKRIATEIEAEKK